MINFFTHYSSISGCRSVENTVIMLTFMQLIFYINFFFSEEQYTVNTASSVGDDSLLNTCSDTGSLMHHFSLAHKWWPKNCYFTGNTD